MVADRDSKEAEAAPEREAKFNENYDESEVSDSCKDRPGIIKPHVSPMRGILLMEQLKASMDNSRRGSLIKTIYSCSILVCAWATSLDSSTTTSLPPLAASSFDAHSKISTLNIATGIISAISLPVYAKFADLISRTFVYIVALFFYILGYIIVASSNTIFCIYCRNGFLCCW